MNNNNYTKNTYYESESSYVADNVSINKMMAGSFLWMFIGALITMLVGIGCTMFLKSMIANVDAGGLMTYLILFFVAFIFQMILTSRIHKNAYVKRNVGKTIVSFLLYSALTGFTFSFIFAYFDVLILNQVFAGVSLYFLLLAGLSFLFRKSIKKAAGFAYMGLLTLVIVSTIMLLFSMFAFNGMYFDALLLAISILGVLVFSIVTMVDVRRNYEYISTTDNKKCAMIVAAFDLYLDFINIFIYILRILMILGKNSSRRN